MNERTVIFLHGHPVRATSHFLEGLSAFAAKRGWSIHSNIPPARAGAAYFRRMMDFWKPVGVVCDACSCQGLPRPSCGMPIVYIDIDPAKRARMIAQKRGATENAIGFVDSDSAEFARIAAEELLRRDFASYAYVSSWRRWHWSARRLEAFREIMARNGKKTLVFSGTNLQTGDAAYMRRIGKWLRTLPKPCGLLAANDRMASLVMAAAAREGVSVPDMVSIVGIDNDSILCESLSPPIASVDADFFGGGMLAGRLLDELVSGNAQSGSTVLYGAKRFVPRLSIQRLTRRAPSVMNALEAIRRRAVEGISAADILPVLGSSRRAAEKRFKAATDKSIMEEILDVRFEKTLALLERANVPLGIIADAAGFTSTNQLQRQFKARYGTTLSGYRKRLIRT